MSVFAYVLAVVLFVLAALGATFVGLDRHDLVALGLGAFAIGHVLPR